MLDLKRYRGLPQWLLAVVVTALLVAVMLIVSFVSTFGVSPSDAQESWGQFGDFVGGILNPLFSVIGLLALLHTIVLQSKELSKSTKELKASAKALKRQNKHNARQQFDNNFFQLLTLNVAQVPGVKLGGGRKQVGEEAFLTSVYSFEHGWDVNAAEGNEWIRRFDSWHRDYGCYFDAYIHSLSNVISFVDNSNVSKETKEFAYVSISSNLSTEVLTVFFLFSTFSSNHCWIRENLEESGFFDWCQMDYFNHHPIWRDIGRLCRVEFDEVRA